MVWLGTWAFAIPIRRRTIGVLLNMNQEQLLMNGEMTQYRWAWDCTKMIDFGNERISNDDTVNLQEREACHKRLKEMNREMS